MEEIFSRAGKKIQVFAKILFWLGIIASIIVGVLMIINGNNLNKIYTDGSYMVLGGFCVIVGGSFVSWFCSLLLYGFGTIVDKNEYKYK